jgi:hypothetical protein
MLSLVKKKIADGYGIRIPRLDGAAEFHQVGEGGTVTPCHRDDVIALLCPRAQGGIGVVLPTYYSRTDESEHVATFVHVAEQLLQACRALPQVPVVLFLGMQCHDHERAATLLRLAAMLKATGRQSWPDNFFVVPLTLPMSFKVCTLNVVFSLLTPLGLRGVGWLDDDVRFTSGSWTALIRRFLDKGGVGAVGAFKRGLQGEHRAARVLFRLKQVTQPAVNYPHGCAILVDARRMSPGIPARYASDDGYVCFEMLDPRRANPLELLELVEGATCFHYVGGPAGQTLKRLRRMLINHAIFMADYPPDVARYYFQNLLFSGLWPLAPLDRSQGLRRGLEKHVLKTIYLGCFSAIAANLLVRGVLGRPLETWKHGSAAGLPSWSTTDVEAA